MLTYHAWDPKRISKACAYVGPIYWYLSYWNRFLVHKSTQVPVSEQWHHHMAQPLKCLGEKWKSHRGSCYCHKNNFDIMNLLNGALGVTDHTLRPACFGWGGVEERSIVLVFAGKESYIRWEDWLSELGQPIKNAQPIATSLVLFFID